MKTPKSIANLNPKTKLILLISAVVLFLGITTVIMIRDRIYDSTINLLIAPASSKIEIDGQTYTNGKHKIPSGKHSIKISKDSFETKEEEIEIKKGETYIYYNYLTQPNDSMKWYEENDEDSLLLESIIPALSEKSFKKLQEQYPLIKQLPINIDEYDTDYTQHINYSISYTTLDNEVQIIIQDKSGNNYETALKKIKSLGFNPEDYTIQYTDLHQNSGWGKAE